MLFGNKKKSKGIESFNPELCKIEKSKKEKFRKDEVAMGCSDGCWDGCIGSCRRFQH